VTGAQIIREARLRAGLTQTGLAERLGCERAQVARWETGRQQATFENLRAAVQACGFVLKVAVARQEGPSPFDRELEANRVSGPEGRVRALLEERPRQARVREEFDPYAMFDALERHEVGYVVIGGFARVIRGSGELTYGLDIVPSLLDKNLRDLFAALLELGADPTPLEALDAVRFAEPSSFELRSGRLAVVPLPWGTGGYKDIRIRANREVLGRGVRPRIASLIDLIRTLEASDRPEDGERLRRVRRMMELDHPRRPRSKNRARPAR
jgi:transcriptional regulator with XRE-family HTH domain